MVQGGGVHGSGGSGSGGSSTESDDISRRMRSNLLTGGGQTGHEPWFFRINYHVFRPNKPTEDILNMKHDDSHPFRGCSALPKENPKLSLIFLSSQDGTEQQWPSHNFCFFKMLSTPSQNLKVLSQSKPVAARH